MTNPHANVDDLLPVSFSLQANPGAYALLLGAGVSAPSGIPTAWGVLEDLVERVAQVHGETPDDGIGWYQGKFGEFPTYEGILERIAPTQIERQRLLRNYFEQSPDDVEAGRKVPTPAHRSIARLVLAGTVKVIITLNFDHLIERALRDEGIEPTILASPADMEGVAPLHTLDCCVIHLHGDYLNPASMLNTVTELKAYHPSKQKLLQGILENYGLVLAGWSSKYDPALRGAIAAHYPNRFTLTWFEPGVASEEATSLRVLKRGLLVAETADSGFGRLADGVDALITRRARHPLSVPVAVESAKRELSGRSVAIRLHDTLKREFAALHQLQEFHLENHNYTTGDYEAMLARVEEASKMTGAIIATLAYWGDEETDSWWLGELPRLATPVEGSGLVKLLSLRVVSGSILFYAAGVSAVAGHRFDLLGRLFNRQRERPYNIGFEPLAVSLDAEAGYENVPTAPTRVFNNVAPLLTEAITVGSDSLDDAWQLFEVLRLAWATLSSPRFAELHSAYKVANEAYEKANTAFENAERGGRDVSSERQVRAAAWQDRDRSLGNLSRLSIIKRPHILVADTRMNERYQSVVATRLLHDLAVEGTAHPLVAGGLVTDPEIFEVAVSAVSLRLGQIGSELSWARVANRSGSVPSQMWLDSGKTPDEVASQAPSN